LKKPNYNIVIISKPDSFGCLAGFNMAWNVRELEIEYNLLKKFEVAWSEVRTDVRRGTAIVEARNEEEARDKFFNDDIVNEQIDSEYDGDWEDTQIDDVIELKE